VAKIDNSKAKLVCLFFKLRPAMKNSVDKHKYKRTTNSFEEHYSEIDEGRKEIIQWKRKR
jgi:hypothetical protein